MGLEGVVNKGMELGEMAFNKVWLITDKCLAISNVDVFVATGCGSAVGAVALVHNIAISCQK
ncbi:hypothetical protein SLEP1_g24653 [Rubroshorea leprosula]|uniref:Uncharacterized protein n=1 Tax=Rubroshorea leprosula TaxID=152421 RepID=A0AAV5JQ38_9ROSI|nr:hypothetical protein SLEP1_g24653 [Rubroshorea leprosula]